MKPKNSETAIRRTRQRSTMPPTTTSDGAVIVKFHASSFVQLIAFSVGCGTLNACVSSHVMIGAARPPIPVESVRLYTRPPSVKYEEIATLDTSSSGSFSFTAQRKSDSVIKRLKEQAAKLGANGVILEGFGDVASGSFGAGGGSDSFSGNSAIGGGAGASFQMSHKAGSGLAIYVPPQ